MDSRRPFKANMLTPCCLLCFAFLCKSIFQDGNLQFPLIIMSCEPCQKAIAWQTVQPVRAALGDCIGRALKTLFFLTCFKHIAILFRPLWEQSFPSDCISIFDSPRELSVMQQLSIYSKRSNKALPLQGCYLAAAWTAYTILKIGFCEIMLVFVHTWHSHNASPVTVVIIKTDLNNTVISLYHMG